MHPAARPAYGVWLAIIAGPVAPAQTAGVAAVARHADELMLVCGFRAYAAARRTGGRLLAVAVEADEAAVEAAAWDEVIAVAEILASPEIARADLVDRLVRQAPERVRRALGVDRGAPLQVADSRFGAPVRARRAFETRRNRPSVIAETLARLAPGGPTP